MLKECQGYFSEFDPAVQEGIQKYNICHQSGEKEEKNKTQQKGEKAINKQRITIHSQRSYYEKQDKKTPDGFFILKLL